MLAYKIKLFKYKLQADITDDLPKVVSYFSAHNINIVFDIQDTLVEKGDALMKLMQPNDGLCDVVIYAFDRQYNSTIYNGITFRVSNTLRGIYLSTSVADDNVNYLWKALCHELMHSLFMKYVPNGNGNIPMDSMFVNNVLMPYFKNEEINPDGTGAIDGNFSAAWTILNQYIPQYQYFSQAEISKWQLKPELWQLLDKARGIAGVPFIITSGLRTTQQNEDAGGVQDSSHLRGLGCDLSVIDSDKRYKILTALLQAGFHRIGVYAKHLHCDIDPSLPPNLIWHKPAN